MAAMMHSLVRGRAAVSRGFLSPVGLRCATSMNMSVNDLRKGMIYWHEGRYKEVTQWHSQRTGRGSPTIQVTHNELDTGISRMDRFGGGAGKVKVITPDRKHLEVSYLDDSDPKETMVNLVDENYEELTLPMSRFSSKQKILAGAKVSLYTNDDDIVKVKVTEAGAQEED
eukprot:TRINITY_DN101921_c0_g1_i1.p1 TRINITY_DN101921_c0_g1~~TRINITY_DN101921_c0_g1_i1.p1  ORF type:complete len:170 (-),score=29.58 TRINITY_DN101921_c0_g1_i1:134-643(-)